MTLETRYHDILRSACEVFARRGFHQASIREIARAADLSLAGLYHYVRGKDELLFLVLDRALTILIDNLDQATAAARTPEEKLLALIRTHVDFAFRRGPDLKLINREYELLPEPRRSEIVAKRGDYLQRGLSILRQLDPHGRSGDELLSATILLLGMLNGVATRPFVKSSDDVRTLAAQVGGLFLYGFLEHATEANGARPERSSNNGPTGHSIVAPPSWGASTGSPSPPALGAVPGNPRPPSTIDSVTGREIAGGHDDA